MTDTEASTAGVITATADSIPAARFMAEALVRHAGIDSADEAVFVSLVKRLTEALAQGHIRIELDSAECDVLKTSAVVGHETHAPLVLSGEALYFGRYFRYEVELAETMSAMAATMTTAMAGAIPDTPDFADAGKAADQDTIVDQYQKDAMSVALNRRLCVISGGPGTGKTTLIVKILRLLFEQYGATLRIGLAAPTGKAAMRMNESIRAQIGAQADEPGIPEDAVTIHRLLGMTRFSSLPRYNEDNPIPYDVVVVDEASMIDLAMMWRLVKGLKRDARLILIGDKDQLASVESGAVLADCIDSLDENVAELKKTYRFNASIASLAEAVKRGDGAEVWAQVAGTKNSETAEDIVLGKGTWLDDICDRYDHYLSEVNKSREAGSYPQLFSLFSEHMVLCALRKGMYGIEEINRRVELKLAEKGLLSTDGIWYPGKPVMISANDHSLSLFNGDIGLCLPDPDENHELRVWFNHGGGRLKKYSPGRIPASETAWAMTIHKAQGSEFGHVTVVLPEIDNQILSRELLYTAVTRARRKLTMVMNQEICSLCVDRKTIRHSGLAKRLKNKSHER